jgi:prevent-host-death family protein
MSSKMTGHRLSSSEFARNIARAKRAADQRPVIITERGEPAYVLMRYDHYRKLTGEGPTIVEMLAQPGDEADFPFEAPRFGSYESDARKP